MSSLRDMYKEVNPATLTGAVDVIVVEQEDGTLACSPFYVRFGKMGVVTSREKVVDIIINDESVNLHMRLSQLGDAYFVEDAVEERDYPRSEWANYNWNADEWKRKDTQSVIKSTKVNDGIVDVDIPDCKPVAQTSAVFKSQDLFGYLSLSLCDSGDLRSLTDELFRANEITFDQFNANPEVIFSPNIVLKWDGKFYKYNVATPILFSLLLYQRPLTDDVINRLLEKYHCASSAPATSALLVNTNLPVQLPAMGPGGALQSSPQVVASPQVDSATATTDFVDMGATSDGDGAAISDGAAIVKQASAVLPAANEPPNTHAAAYTVSSWFSWRRGSSTEPQNKGVTVTHDGIEHISASPPQYSSEEYLHSPPLSEELNEYNDRECSSPNQLLDRGALSDSEIDRPYKRTPVRYKKTLHLTSDQLKTLKLRPGQANHAVFSVTTKYQGTCACECDIYLWSWNDKIVVSDIDGTITKSDVLGHILPIVGWQWEHSNVVELYERIMDNGYRFIYLTARAIGQSHQTKDYLRSIKQNTRQLPEGPLLLSPTSLFMALHREVIEKKPEIFKTKCLRDVKALFPEWTTPFYAGFGNKATDEISYKAAGILPHRIFTINTQGEVRFVEKDLRSSYHHILDLADHIFPPLRSSHHHLRFPSGGSSQPSFTMSADSDFAGSSQGSQSATDLAAQNQASQTSPPSNYIFSSSSLHPEEYSTSSFWRRALDISSSLSQAIDLTKFPAPSKNGKKSASSAAKRAGDFSASSAKVK